ncbi:hypothetical protein MKW98_002876 [Papaver atlanticum]|uniref:Uncharacterized protein n=1 Tax=Papaver atlanticum TaxID=357466 RepID=A0AAD4TCU6_9MAGN|nr:hypothetical protein MKW98_002876 [Papaver atlanticum]
MTPHDKQVMMFSATLSKEICPVCRKFMQDKTGKVSNIFSSALYFMHCILGSLLNGAEYRLWFKTNLKLCKIWFDMGGYARMNKILKELHKSCRKEDGTDD